MTCWRDRLCVQVFVEGDHSVNSGVRNGGLFRGESNGNSLGSRAVECDAGDCSVRYGCCVVETRQWCGPLEGRL